MGRLARFSASQRVDPYPTLTYPSAKMRASLCESCLRPRHALSARRAPGARGRRCTGAGPRLRRARGTTGCWRCPPRCTRSTTR